jgi:hypothetical protein
LAEEEADQEISILRVVEDFINFHRKHQFQLHQLQLQLVVVDLKTM